jgi:hypothetical protein
MSVELIYFSVLQMYNYMIIGANTFLLFYVKIVKHKKNLGIVILEL